MYQQIIVLYKVLLYIVAIISVYVYILRKNAQYK